MGKVYPLFLYHQSSFLSYLHSTFPPPSTRLILISFLLLLSSFLTRIVLDRRVLDWVVGLDSEINELVEGSDLYGRYPGS